MQARRHPLISVVMPVHNGVPYLAESIHSILVQTLDDFEFVILDDASTDGTPRILRDWAQRDSRIRLIQNSKQLGISGALNSVVREARAPICARMDADDLSHPDRLKRQWEVLLADPEVALVGSLWEGIDAQGRCVRPRDRWRLLRGSSLAPFPHGSIMFRRDVFWGVGGYRAAVSYSQDLDLYLRICQRGRTMVLPDALYRYRFHANSMTLSSPVAGVTRDLDLMRLCIAVKRAGGDYTSMLQSKVAGANPGETVSAETRYYLGASRLWAGHRPRISEDFGSFRSLPWSGATLKAVALGVWGGLRPSTLRRVLRWSIWLRDQAVRGYFRDGNPVEWRFQ
jgi:glycosyltransferase involved in cell wall biosynthesis